MRVPVGGPSAPVQSPNTATPRRTRRHGRIMIVHPTGIPSRAPAQLELAERLHHAASQQCEYALLCRRVRRSALPIRREHPEMVGESIVQGFLIASIILCTFGSVVSVYG